MEIWPNLRSCGCLNPEASEVGPVSFWLDYLDYWTDHRCHRCHRCRLESGFFNQPESDLGPQMDGPIYCICEPVRVRLPELSASKLLVIWQKHEVRKDSCGLESQKHFQCFVQPCHFPRARPIFRMTLLRSPPVIAWSVSCHKQGPWCNAGPSWFETKPNNSRWPICFHLILRRFKLWSPFQLRVLEDGTPVQDVRFAKGMNVHDILTIFRCLNLGGCLNLCARLKPLIQMQTPHQRCGWPNTFPGRWYKSRILIHQCIPRHFDTPMTSMRPWEEPCIIWTDRGLDTQSQIVLETTAQESDWIQLASIWAGTNSPTFLPHIFQACLPLPNLRAHQTQRQCPAGDPDSHTAIPRPGHQFDQD